MTKETKNTEMVKKIPQAVSYVLTAIIDLFSGAGAQAHINHSATVNTKADISPEPALFRCANFPTERYTGNCNLGRIPTEPFVNMTEHNLCSLIETLFRSKSDMRCQQAVF